MSLLKQVRLTKYGFIRRPDWDFSDDGNRFTCYEYYGCRVSYLKSDGVWYIAARYEKYELSWEERKDLPCYHDLDMLNGVDSVSEEDIEKLKASIVIFVRAYDAKADLLNKNNPTMDEMKTFRDNYRNYYKDLKKQIDDRFKASILKLGEYALSSFKRYYDGLERQCECYDDEYLQSIFGTGLSRQFMKSKTSDFYYRELDNYLKRVGL